MNRIILTIALSLSLLAVGKTMEVFIKAPGMKPVQCVYARCRFAWLYDEVEKEDAK